jgi:uncharacterized protein
MKRRLIGLVVLALLLAACTQADPGPVKDAWGEKGSEFVAHLAAGEYEEAFAYFDETMANALPLDDLILTWNSVQEQAGEYVGEATQERQTQTPYEIVIVTGEFADAYIDIRMVFDANEKIAGLFFQPSTYTP